MWRSRRCVWRDNGSACRTESCCTTHGCYVSKNPCHRTCRRSNDREGNKEGYSVGAVQTAQQLKVERYAVSAGPSAIRHGAIPVSRLEVSPRAKRHSERRAAAEDDRHP